MATDKSGIRIKRVGPDEETAALPAPAETPTTAARRPTGTRTRTTPTSPTADVAGPSHHPVQDDRGTGSGWQERLGGHPARETKPFWLTSEFLLTLATIAAVVIAGYANDDSLNAWRTWLLVTVIAAAYVLSRGIAKAGSADRR